MAGQARHPQIEELGGLGAADPGRAARVDRHVVPGGGALVEGAGDAGERGVGLGQRAGPEDGVDRLLARRAPHRAQIAGAGARRRPGRARRQPDRAANRAADRQHRGRRDQATAPARRRIGVEVGEQGLHRRVARRRRRGQAADQDRPQPRRHVGVGRRCVDLAAGHGGPQLVAPAPGERRHAVERAVERDAEAELIAAGVGDAEELLRRHVLGRADDAADLGELAVEQAAAGRPRARDAVLGQGLRLGVRVVVGVVAGRLVDVPRLRGQLAGPAAGGAGQAEVEDADPAVAADQDVARA